MANITNIIGRQKKTRNLKSQTIFTIPGGDVQMHKPFKAYHYVLISGGSRVKKQWFSNYYDANYKD